MKKILILLSFLIISVNSFSQSNSSTYKEMSIARYNAQKESFQAGEKICFKRVTLSTNFENNYVAVWSDSGARIYAFMSKEALNWLLDYSESDNRWQLRFLNVYGVVLSEKESNNGYEVLNEKFRIEKIEFN